MFTIGNSLDVIPLHTHEERSGEDVLMQLVTKEFIHYMECVNRALIIESVDSNVGIARTRNI